MNSVHEKQRFPCQQCKKSYSSQYYLVTHEKKIHLNEYGHSIDPNSHMESIYEEQSLPYKNSTTDKSTCTTKIKHQRLNKISTSEPSASDKSFIRKANLVGPDESVHLKKQFFCDFCSRSSSSKSKLTQHIKAVHVNQKTIPCPECGKTFAHSSYLHRHVKRSHLQHRISCTLCKKSFTDKSTFNKHMKSVHLKQRFKCDQCDDYFTQKQSLRRHIDSTHLKLRQFSCVECGQSFGGSPQLNAHMRSIHEKQRFPCDQCEKSFSAKHSLITHIKSIHLNP